MQFSLGIDAGSTTVKYAVIDRQGNIVRGGYERHRSDPRKTLILLMEEMLEDPAFAEGSFDIAVTGSGGIALSSTLGVPFIQEVVASSLAVRQLLPSADVAIELGGEDAKITYFSGGIEQRMNGACAGGTGAFIDQMAALLDTDARGLNELAKGATTIYPIAARCGVFAKTDVQPLINEGARKEDIAASVFQAVVNQTIGGLACGKPIVGKVAFLGGPLHFLPETRRRFEETLRLAEDEVLVPENSQLFVALGAALWARDTPASKKEAGSSAVDIVALRHRVRALCTVPMAETERLPPLFRSEEELAAFKERHARAAAPRLTLQRASGPCFLGLDAGSTTTKMVMIDASGAIVAERYENNGGRPLALAVEFLKDLYAKMPSAAWIARACSTGYGEAIVQAGITLDQGEVETVAHFRAARAFAPDVDFVLDIGGQDMKCLRAKDGAIYSILLNEACSSGCGSFLETFARTLDLDAPGFATTALDAVSPADLGTRCTVFMNSRVKQAQKEGASVSDISAGLSYSVVKNALFKVIKLRDPKALGARALVQGGTFLNDAVLRAFELVSEREVIRPDVAALMGAYGAALLAMDAWRADGADTKSRSSIAGMKELETFSIATSMRRCEKCPNACLLTITDFGNGGRFVSGNRCERGAEPEREEIQATGAGSPHRVAAEAAKNKDLNLFAWKLSRLFRYESLPESRAPRGAIGIPRTLETYEHYPYWHTFFTELGYRVVLSPRSTRRIFELGMSSIPSESVCFPGKLVHGHVESLLAKKVPIIFHPCIPVEAKEDPQANNHFNCPIVASYSEVIKNNVDGTRREGIKYLNPFLPFDNPQRLAERLVEEFGALGCAKEEVLKAAEAAQIALEDFRSEVRDKGEDIIRNARARNVPILVLAGRPYHLDPEVNHGIPELAASLGWAVLTEDSVAHLGRHLIKRPLRVVDQWTFHSRLYAAAAFAAAQKDVEFAQLVSFGCGLDAVTADQAEEILRAKGKLYTLLKIDEGANLGAARIRLRSLSAAVAERQAREGKGSAAPLAEERVRPVFTKEMRKTRTILAPQLSPIHFRLVEAAFRHSGYKIEVLPETDSAAVSTGLKYVNNDACYPSILVVGQLLEALESGRYDPDSVALLVTQTGGACRATNYIAFIRRALDDAGLSRVPVISLSAAGIEKNPGFVLTPALAHRGIMALVYGDILMRTLYRTRPYELVQGSANALKDVWSERLRRELRHLSPRRFRNNIERIVADFDALPLAEGRKPRVGVVGEILVKFHPTANGDIVGAIEKEGAEAVVPDFLDFFFYSAHTGIFKRKALSGGIKGDWGSRIAVWVLERYRRSMARALEKSERFDGPVSIYRLEGLVEGVVQTGNIAGEGWFLTAEMLELIESGVKAIACVQPFACLPNHVTGKGVIKELRRLHPEATISAIDYDPGASEVNQINRLKLLLSSVEDQSD